MIGDHFRFSQEIDGQNRKGRLIRPSEPRGTNRSCTKKPRNSRGFWGTQIFLEPWNRETSLQRTSHGAGKSAQNRRTPQIFLNALNLNFNLRSSRTKPTKALKTPPEIPQASSKSARRDQKQTIVIKQRKWRRRGGFFFLNKSWEKENQGEEGRAIKKNGQVGQSESD